MNKPNQFFIFGIIALFIIISGWQIFKKRKPHQENTIATLIIGTNSEFPPFVSLENKNLVGFDVDIATEVAKRLQVQKIIQDFEFKDLPFDALIPEIQVGHIHIIAAGMSPTAEREKRVFFTTPYLKSNPLAILTHKTNDMITSVDDLAGKTVAVNEGYLADKYISQFKEITINRLASASIGEGVLSLESGRSDAFIAAISSIKPFLQNKNADKFKVVIIPNTAETDAIAVSKRYPDLYTHVEKIIQEMIADGTVETFKQKWNLND